MVDVDDSPREEVYTGRPAAFFKDTICRYALFNVPIQWHFPEIYDQPLPGGTHMEV